MKTIQQALKMATILEKEADGLPDLNSFGGSNHPAQEQSREWARALRDYADRGTMPESDDLLEIKYWITGEGWSSLSDYG